MSGLGQNIHLLHCAAAAVQATVGWATEKRKAKEHLQGGKGEPRNNM